MRNLAKLNLVALETKNILYIIVLVLRLSKDRPRNDYIRGSLEVEDMR